MSPPPCSAHRFRTIPWLAGSARHRALRNRSCRGSCRKAAGFPRLCGFRGRACAEARLRSARTRTSTVRHDSITSSLLVVVTASSPLAQQREAQTTGGAQDPFTRCAGFETSPKPRHARAVEPMCPAMPGPLDRPLLAIGVLCAMRRDRWPNAGKATPALPLRAPLFLPAPPPRPSTRERRIPRTGAQQKRRAASRQTGASWPTYYCPHDLSCFGEMGKERPDLAVASTRRSSPTGR